VTEQHARGVLVAGNGGGYAGQDVLGHDPVVDVPAAAERELLGAVTGSGGQTRSFPARRS
jgi:hypothetical protein